MGSTQTKGKAASGRIRPGCRQCSSASANLRPVRFGHDHDHGGDDDDDDDDDDAHVDDDDDIIMTSNLSFNMSLYRDCH